MAGVPVTALLIVAWAARAESPPASMRPRAPRATAVSTTAMATVGPLSISRAEFERNFQQGMDTYRARTGREIPDEYRPPLRRQLLETLIRQKLLELEVERRGLQATPEEAELELRKDPAFQTRGVFDEAKFLAIKHGQPEAFHQAVEAMRRTLPTRRLAETIERGQRTDDSALRASVARSLAGATVALLSLTRAGIDPLVEPREVEIVRAYQARRGEFAHPEEATLSVLFVNQPPLSDADASRSSVRRDWELRMRQRADSILAAVRGGAVLDSIAAPFGGLKRRVVVNRGRFPAYWRGGSRFEDAVFGAAPGSILPEPVPGVSGSIVARVDQVHPAGVSPLSDVAPRLREELRAAARERRDQQQLQALYASLRDSLRGPAFRIRYAVADTSSFTPPEPTPAEMDRFYRGHLADYSWFDAASGGVVAKPFAEARTDVRERIVTQRRVTLAREAAQRLFSAWSRGKRDAGLERAMTFVKETDWVPAGGVVDSGLAGAALTDTLASHLALGRGLTTFPRGLIVYHVFDHNPSIVPGFDRARPLLVSRMVARRDAEEERGARALFDASPRGFASGTSLRYGRVVVPTIPALAVPLSRAEVEKYYRDHIDDYSAPELARVRHILVSPADATPAADAAARRKAEDLLRRVRAGESFATLARENSDDSATREDGGDVGVFSPGQMLPEFDRAAFAMRVGDLVGPVRTEAGYHILECLERAPREKTPLAYCYSNVGSDAAREKGEAMAHAIADSLLRAARTPARAVAEAHRRNWLVYSDDHVIGGPDRPRDYYEALERLKPGQFYSKTMQIEGTGWAITWVEGTIASGKATWEEARSRAIQAYRDQVLQRAVVAKRAELDSLEAAGWSLDSLAALRGGFERHEDVTRGTALLGGREQLDSLVFGRSKPPVLRPGETSPWSEFPLGMARVRLLERHDPDPVQLATRLELERRRARESALESAYEALKRRYPVRILDDQLRATPLPQMPDS